jgi:hypothetical protein
MTWQPIDTAPKDGTAILIHPAAGEMRVVHWRIDRGYWSTDSWDDGGYDADMHPTHWMPLPPPPEDLVEPMYCMDCGAEQPHHCQGVPGGFGEEPQQ